MRIVMAEPPTAEKGKSFNNETLLIGENARLVNQTVRPLLFVREKGERRAVANHTQ